MRRVAEMGAMLLVCIIAMNSAIIVFSPSIETTTTITQAAPNNSDVNSSIANTKSVISIAGLADLVLLPFNVASAIIGIANQVLKFFFAYNDVLSASGLPVEISNFINLTFNSIIVIVIFVTILDTIIALKGR